MESLERIRYSLDHRRWCHDTLTIRNKRGMTVPLELTPAQAKLTDLIANIERQNRPVRIVALKARQVHMSVGVASHLFKRVPFFDGQQGVVMANDDDTSAVLFDYYKQFSDGYKANAMTQPLPGLLKDTDRHLRWENHAAIEVRTAGAKNPGRGRSRRFGHLSEYAFWENAERTMAGVMQSIPYDPGTVVIIESTANGHGGSFWERCQEAMSGQSEWEFLFYAWWEHPEYALPLPVDLARFRESLTGEESALVERYGLKLEQIQWRRKKISEMNGNLDYFRQEFPSNPEEAFLMSGRQRFNAQAVARQPVIREPLTGKLKTSVLGTREQTTFEADERGPVSIFKMPSKGSRYVIGADSSRGLDAGQGRSDPDYCVAQVIDIDTGEQAASFHDRLNPATFAEYLAALGRFYNLAYLVPEANEWGFMQALLMQDYPIGRIYERRPDPANARPPTANELGFLTTSTSKPMMISALDVALLDGSLVVRKARTVSELMSYVIDSGGRTNAQQGCHDDEVIALGLAVMGLNAARLVRAAPKHNYTLESDALKRSGEWEPQRYM
jgi:hypothetical protein